MTTPTAPPGTDRRSTPSSGESWLGSRKKPDTGSRLRGGRRRRSVPHLLLGALLVLACAAGFVLWSLNVGQRQPVLALARPAAVGHVLSAQDLRQVNIAADPGVSTVAGSKVSTVVGKSMATSLPAGALLSPEVLGTAAVPGQGQAIAALALKAGQFPPELAPGARVSVVFVRGSATGSSSIPPSSQDNGSTWPATVTSVTARANEQTTVVSVQLSEAAARQVAAVPSGQLSVVMLAGGGQ